MEAQLDEAGTRELEGVGDEDVDDLEQLDLVDQDLRLPRGRQFGRDAARFPSSPRRAVR